DVWRQDAEDGVTLRPRAHDGLHASRRGRVVVNAAAAKTARCGVKTLTTCQRFRSRCAHGMAGKRYSQMGKTCA
ncbi:MAG: hypothetical protein M3P13_12885, partial [Acidobacteriota bacterium]|nr:hypothetical protein [Acidobacteriota bacterium]